MPHDLPWLGTAGELKPSTYFHRQLDRRSSTEQPSGLGCQCGGEQSNRLPARAGGAGMASLVWRGSGCLPFPVCVLGVWQAHIDPAKVSELSGHGPCGPRWPLAQMQKLRRLSPLAGLEAVFLLNCRSWEWRPTAASTGPILRHLPARPSC